MKELTELLPLLVCAPGRTGTTLLMQLLGRDPNCFFDKLPPYEMRYLTYICKIASIWERHELPGLEQGSAYAHWTLPMLGISPWGLRSLRVDQLDGFAKAKDVLTCLWNLMAESCERQQPGCRYYAEKTPYWVVPMVRNVISHCSIYLFRDPRDVYLSINGMNKKKGTFWFYREPGEDEFNYAISLALEIQRYYENYAVVRGRPDSFAVRYEDLIEDPDAALSGIREQVGLHMTGSLDASIAEEHRTAASVKESVGRFQREELDPVIRECLEKLLQDIMLEFGYLSERTQDTSHNRFEFNQSVVDRLRVLNDGSLSTASNGMTAVTVNGDDFHLILPVPSFEARKIREIWVCFAGRAGSRCSVYWRRGNQDFDAERGMHVRYYPGEHFDIIRFNVFEHPLWTGTIDELRLDLFKEPHTVEPTGPLYLRWMQLVEGCPARAESERVSAQVSTIS